MPLPPARSDKWRRRSRKESGSSDRREHRNRSVAISAASHPSHDIIVFWREPSKRTREARPSALAVRRRGALPHARRDRAPSKLRSSPPKESEVKGSQNADLKLSQRDPSVRAGLALGVGDDAFCGHPHLALCKRALSFDI